MIQNLRSIIRRFLIAWAISSLMGLSMAAGIAYSPEDNAILHLGAINWIDIFCTMQINFLPLIVLICAMFECAIFSFQ